MHLLKIFFALLLLGSSLVHCSHVGRKLHQASICNSGYKVDGGCIDQLAIYLPGEGTLSLSDANDWTNGLLGQGMELLIGKVVGGYGTCIMDILQNEPSGSCACEVACVAARVKTGVPSMVCEGVCRKLINLYSQIADEQRSGGGDSSSSGSDSGSGFGCFPADSVAIMADGSRRKMKDLAIGDKIMTISESGTILPSSIYGFAHHLPNLMHTHMTITTEQGQSLTATPDHYVYVAEDSKHPWKNRKAIAAGKVRPGQLVWVLNNTPAGNATAATATNTFILANITSVTQVTARGIINPFTVSGTIVVDGVAASVYNDLMGSEARMHAFTVFIRWMYKVSPELMRLIHSSGVEKLCQQFLTGLLSLGNGKGRVATLANVVIALPKMFAEPF